MRNINLVLTILALSLLFTACGAGVASVTGTSGKPKVGDTVVAKWSTGSYYEGKVEKIDGAKMTIAWEDKSQSTVIDAADVYMIPAAGTTPDVKQGDMVLAKTAAGAYWNGSEVAGLDAGAFKVRPVTGTTMMNVAGDKIIKVPAAAAADFKQAAGSTDFLAEAKKGKVTVPADYKPKKGDPVLAEWSAGSWWAGKIDNVSGSNIYVAWNDNSKPSAINISKVLPLPTGKETAMPTEKQFVLVKPESGSAWQYGQANSITGNRVEVKLANNQFKTVTAGEFVLLN
jgi:hypothetical protein